MISLKKDKEKKPAEVVDDVAEVVSAESIDAVPPTDYILPI